MEAVQGPQITAPSFHKLPAGPSGHLPRGQPGVPEREKWRQLQQHLSVVGTRLGMETMENYQ